MIRLDKFLSDINLGTRSEVKNLIKKGLIKVNDVVIKDPDTKIDEKTSIIVKDGVEYSYERYHYFLLNKPSGVVSANTDSKSKTVIDLFNEITGHKYKDEYFCCGRLDIDTTGLLLITNDGALTHKVLSPKYHVDKTYKVTCKYPVSKEDKVKLEAGVDMGEGYISKPAKVTDCALDNEILLTIHEGKFHQVKRMIKAIDNEVTALKRISFGSLILPDDLPEGKLIELTSEQIEELKNV